MKLSIPIILALGLAACGSTTVPATNEAEAAAEGVPLPAMANATSSPTISAKELGSVCKAAIASSFGRSASIMQIVSNEGGIVRVHYKRPNDGTQWTNDCRVEADRILWRTVNASAGSGVGVWRTRPEDDVLTFRINDRKVEIATQYAGGSGTNTETYPML